MCVQLNEVKTQLGISGSTEDEKLVNMISQATAVAERYTRCSFSQATVTEYHDGPGASRFVLSRTPISSITSIHVSNSIPREWGTSELVDSDNYTFDAQSGVVTRFDTWWPARREHKPGNISGGHSLSYGSRSVVATDTKGLANIQAIYSGGPSELPDDLRLAVINIIASIRNMGAAGGPLASESLDYYSYTLGGTNQALAGTREILNRHRKMIV